MSLMKMSHFPYQALLVLVLTCVVPASAHAAVIYDEIIVQDVLGTVLASVSATPQEITDNPDEVFYVPGIPVDPSQYGNFGIVTDGDGNLLELFGIGHGGPDDIDLAFGGQGVANSYYLQNPVLDTGAPIDLTQYLDPALQAAGDTASFIVADVSAVPEPLTWAMMVVGFAAIGGGMRRDGRIQRVALAKS